MVCDWQRQVCGRRRRADGGGGGGGGSGYRIKNKNPTQSCGEKEPCTGYVASLFFGFAKVEVLFSMDVSETLCNAKLVCLHHCIISSYTICTGSAPRWSKWTFLQGTKSSCSQTRSLVKPELTQPGLITSNIARGSLLSTNKSFLEINATKEHTCGMWVWDSFHCSPWLQAGSCLNSKPHANMPGLADTCKARGSVRELSLDKRARVLEETCSVWRTLNDKHEILVTNPNCLSTTSSH